MPIAAKRVARDEPFLDVGPRLSVARAIASGFRSRGAHDRPLCYLFYECSITYYCPWDGSP